MKTGARQHDGQGDKPNDETDAIRAKADRMARARRSKNSGWRSLAHIGILGWLFILPTVLGAFLGRLAARLTGFRGAAIVGLLLGVFAGGFAVYRHVRRAIEDDRGEKEKP